jgi:hypothetical protein
MLSGSLPLFLYGHVTVTRPLCLYLEGNGVAVRVVKPLTAKIAAVVLPRYCNRRRANRRPPELARIARPLSGLNSFLSGGAKMVGRATSHPPRAVQ